MNHFRGWASRTVPYTYDLLVCSCYISVERHTVFIERLTSIITTVPSIQIASPALRWESVDSDNISSSWRIDK